jgi:hypothetical protein
VQMVVRDKAVKYSAMGTLPALRTPVNGRVTRIIRRLHPSLSHEKKNDRPLCEKSKVIQTPSNN